MVSPAAYKLAERLVEQNIVLFRRRLTQEELRWIYGDQPCSKNELKRKGLCFICKEPWGPNHSYLRDVEEMVEVQQKDIPSVFQDENSSLDESMGSYEGASGEHEQSCVFVDSGPYKYSSVYGEQSVSPMGDIQDDESPVMIQQEQHMVEHESVEDNDMHSMHDEPMMEEDEQPSLGPAINAEQADVQRTHRTAVFANTCPQEL